MSTVRYTGPHDGVRLPLPTGRDLEVAHGQEIDLASYMPERDLPAFVGSLLEQTDNWAQVAPKPPAKTPPPKAPAADKEG